MRSKVIAGIVAGLIAGLPFGIMMQLMQAPTPDGGQVPMMMMVAMVVRSESLLVGWLYHLLNSAVIGALFGVLLGTAAGANTSRNVALGAAGGWSGGSSGRSSSCPCCWECRRSRRCECRRCAQWPWEAWSAT